MRSSKRPPAEPRPVPRLPALYLTPDWPAPPGVQALTTVRRGGVSEAPFKSLNFGPAVGDAPAALAENRRRLAEAAGLPAEPQWLRQVHGTVVADLDAATRPEEADAAVTRRAGVVCALLTADCLPVLFARRDGSAVGAAHAGWRGLAAGVLERTAQALIRPGEPADALLAWMGPAISPAHFEVGEEVRAAFVAAPGVDRRAAEGAFVRNDRGRWQCDLYALARLRLEHLGMSQIFGEEHCTFAETARFFSHRRDAGRTGRMATLIWRTVIV
jgi:YfiH family protein